MENSIDVVVPCKEVEDGLGKTISSLLDQKGLNEYQLSLIAVDDGSRMPLSLSSSGIDIPVTVLRTQENRGRSAAINSGLKASKAKYCLIMDADCYLDNEYSLFDSIKKLNANVSFCFGRTISEGNDFWALYHNSVHQTRVQSQNVMSLTTACFLVDRKKLLDAGGFSEEYKHYGFEDKDLVATLLDTYGSSSISVNEDLVAVHNDKQTVSSVAKKFKLSAEYSAKIFNSRFPKFYSQLSYASFDARCISKLRNSLFLLTSPCVLVLTSPIQFLVNSNVIPFSVKKKLVQLICAMAYYSGSKAD